MNINFTQNIKASIRDCLTKYNENYLNNVFKKFY